MGGYKVDVLHKTCNKEILLRESLYMNEFSNILTEKKNLIASQFNITQEKVESWASGKTDPHPLVRKSILSRFPLLSQNCD